MATLKRKKEKDFDSIGLDIISEMMKSGAIPRTIVTRIRGKKKVTVEITDDFMTEETINFMIAAMDEALQDNKNNKKNKNICKK